MRFLVVDDEEDIRLVIGVTLEDHGHEVLEAGDPLEAMALLAVADVDAIILDVLMPKMTGFDLIRLLRRDLRTRHLPILFLSALGEGADRIKGLRLGANDYLAKPFDPEEVMVRLERLVSTPSVPPGGSVGDLAETTILDVFQSMEHAGRTGVLRVMASGRSGWVSIRKGVLVASRRGLLVGVDATLAMMEQRQGLFTFEPVDHIPGTGSESHGRWTLPGLALEYSRLCDELEAMDPLREERPLGIGRPVSPEAEREDLERFNPIIERVWALPGITLEELLRQEFQAPLRLRVAAGLLLSEGHLRYA